MLNRAQVLLSCLVLAFLSAGNSVAHTWFVEKDGSGDFTVIQDAADAAAAGDTIRIGPGRFDDLRLYSFPGGDYQLVVNLPFSDLTVVGSGPDSTFVGLETTEPEVYTAAFFSIDNGTQGKIEISDLAMEGCYFGFTADLTSPYEIRNCHFSYCSDGIFSSVEGSVSKCRFDNIAAYGILSANVDGPTRVFDCQFRNNGEAALYFQRSDDVVVANCSLRDSRSGGVLDRSSGSVDNCTFENLLATGLAALNCNQVSFTGNTIRGMSRNMWIDHSVNVRAEGNVLSGSVVTAVLIFNCIPVFNGNHIERGQGWAVELGSEIWGDDPTLDFTSNYWGTTSADSISAWILDANDEGGPTAGVVVFEPFSADPLETKKELLGGFKSVFRDATR